MPNLIIPVGIPGCGKSTWAEQFYGRSSDVIVSTDAIRAAMGDVNDQTQNDRVFAKFHALIKNSLIDGRDVFADATNLRDFARERLRKIAEEANIERKLLRRPADVKTHLVIFTNPNQAVVRNFKRERVVPIDVMGRMMDQYETFMMGLGFEKSKYDSVTQIKKVG